MNITRCVTILLGVCSFIACGQGAAVPPPPGLVSWWRGENNASDTAWTNAGTLLPGGGYAAGVVGNAFSFNGSSGGVKVPASASLNVGTGSGLTIECWIGGLNPSAQNPLVEWNNGSMYGTHLWLLPVGQLYANLMEVSGKDHPIYSSANVVSSNAQYVAITYDQASGVAVLYANGAAVATQTLGSFTPQTSYDLYFGVRPQGSYYKGRIDEVSLYNRALTATEIQAIYNAGSSGKTGAPSIVTQPVANQLRKANETVTFHAEAHGPGTVSSQWRQNGNGIGSMVPGASATTSFPANSFYQGNWSIVFSNAYGTAVSSNATFTVIKPPVGIDADQNGVEDVLEDVKLASSQQFSSTPFIATGAIEAEQFDKGGPDVGYHTTGTGTTDYRVTGMYIEPCTDLGKGYCVSRTKAGDWMKYSFQVMTAGVYTIEARVASDTIGGTFRYEFGNSDGTFSYTTDPLTIDQTGWTHLRSANIQFPAAGNYSFKIRMLSAAPNDQNGYVGKFNYFSIYPYIAENTFPAVTNVVTGLYEGDQGTNFAIAYTNAHLIQQAVDQMPTAGGTVSLPSGTYYLAPTVDLGANYEATNRWAGQNCAINIARDNIRLAGAANGTTVLKQQSRSVSMILIASRGAPCIFTNITIDNIVFKGRPHTRLDGSYESGWFSNWGSGASDFVTIGNSQRVFVQNCIFLNAVSCPIYVCSSCENLCIRSNRFLFYTGESPDGEPGGMPLRNDGATVSSSHAWVGIMGSGTGEIIPANRVLITDNYFNGTSYVPPVNFSWTNSCTDGLVWFQGGANIFVSRNQIENYSLEGTQFWTGPAAVVGNTFDTYQYTPSTLALAIYPYNPAFTDINDLTFSFVGNSVTGGRQGVVGQSNTNWSLPEWNLTLCGNELTLDPPLSVQPPFWNEAFGGLGDLINCAALNCAGNTVHYAGFGVWIKGENRSGEFLKNDFRGADQFSFSYEDTWDTSQYVTITKNILSHGNLADDILGRGKQGHLRLNYSVGFNSDGSPKYYMLQDQFLDLSGNPGQPYILPLNAAGSVYVTP